MFTSLIIWFKALVNCPKCSNPASIYLFKTNNRKTKKRCEICSNLTIKIPWRRRHQFLLLTLNTNHTFFYFFYCWLWLSQCQLGNDSVNDFLLVSIANFEHISHIILGFSLLTLKKQMLKPLFHVNLKKNTNIACEPKYKHTSKGQGFSNTVKVWGTFLPGGVNLRRSDFDHSNLFQS